MVHWKRTMVVAGVLTLAGMAVAQITGPTPLSWRWQQSTSVVPGTMSSKGDVIYAAVGRRVYALDRTTGNQRWRFPAGDPIQGNFNRGALLVGNTVVAAADNRTVYGLNVETGAKVWEITAPTPLAGNPVVAGNLVVLPMADETLYAVRSDDGEPAWRNPVPIQNGIYGQIAAEGTDVFVANGAFEFFAIDTLRGTPRWRVQFAQLSPDVQPVFAEDVIYVISGDNVFGLARQNGGQRVRIPVGEQTVFAPAVSGGQVTVVTEQGMVKTFSRQGRQLHKPLDLESVAVTAPAVVGGKIVVNTANGNMNMIEPADGSLLWQYTLRPSVKPTAGANGVTPPNVMTASGPVKIVGDTLFLTGRDGQILAFDPKTGVDLTAPTVKMIFPQNGMEMSGRTNVGSGEQIPFFLWDIEDLTTGVKMNSLKVTIDGREAKYAITKDGQIAVLINGGDNPGLTDGPKTLVVTVADWLGNTARGEFRVFIDNTLPALKTSSGSSGGGQFGSGRDF